MEQHIFFKSSVRKSATLAALNKGIRKPWMIEGEMLTRKGVLKAVEAKS